MLVAFIYFPQHRHLIISKWFVHYQVLSNFSSFTVVFDRFSCPALKYLALQTVLVCSWCTSVELCQLSPAETSTLCCWSFCSSLIMILFEPSRHTAQTLLIQKTSTRKYRHQEKEVKKPLWFNLNLTKALLLWALSLKRLPFQTKQKEISRKWLWRQEI